MEYLRKDDIILINQLTVERHGGAFILPSNLLKEASLKYLVEAITYTSKSRVLYVQHY